VEERYLPPATRRRLYIGSVLLIAVGLVSFILLLVSVLTHSGFERFDQPVEAWVDAWRSPGLTGFMIALAVVFGPVALPIIVLTVTVAGPFWPGTPGVPYCWPLPCSRASSWQRFLLPSCNIPGRPSH
jgi:undecaprenyl-diphosphatase